MITLTRGIRGIAVFAAAGALVFAGATAASADALPPAYYPSGPQTNVDPGDLTGWTLCFSGGFEEVGAPLYGAGGILDELCTGDYLLLAASAPDSSVLALLAAAPRADVLTDTTTDTTTTHNANGSEWYFNDNWSWGFALGGDPVKHESCDTISLSNPELRLCWHTSVQTLSTGYRAGVGGSYDDWTRYIFQPSVVAPAPAPALAATGRDASAPLVLAGGLLAVGVAAIVITAAARRRSAI